MLSVLETHKLTKQYGDLNAVEGVDIRIEKGQIYGLVGKNGAGKTTLIRMITGQTMPTDGGIALFGKLEPDEHIKMRRRIGSIVETPSFYPFLSAEKNLEYYRLQRGSVDRHAVEEALEITGLGDTGKKPFKKFSLGMKQRLGLALAIMDRPDFLVLDEPINGLDPMGIVEIRNILLQLHHDHGTTILISSHILSELSNIATHYGFIDQGRMLEQTTAEEIREKCKDYLEIMVDDTAKAAIVLEQKLFCTDYEVLPGQMIKIYAYLNDIGAVTRELAQAGISIMGANTHGADLEEYYIRLLGEAEGKRGGMSYAAGR